jgi:hypothetical protein
MVRGKCSVLTRGVDDHTSVVGDFIAGVARATREVGDYFHGHE